MSGFFFANKDAPLFGYYQKAAGEPANQNPVLICAPLGHEYYKTHWCLRRLATLLTRKSCSVLRFDYRGTGDSAGSLSDASSIEHWMDNAYAAACELCDRTGATQVDVIGLRTGAVFGSAVASTGKVRRLILWEPQMATKDIVEQWRTMHSTLVDLWPTKLPQDAQDEAEELLGCRFPKKLLNELESFQFGNRDDLKCDKAYVVSSSKNDFWRDNGYESFEVDDQDEWSQIQKMEMAWLPVPGPSQIVELLQNRVIGDLSVPKNVVNHPATQS